MTDYPPPPSGAYQRPEAYPDAYPPPAAYPPPPPPAPPSAGRRRWPWIVGGVVAVLAIIAGVVGAVSGDDDPRSEVATSPDDSETTEEPTTTERRTTTTTRPTTTTAPGPQTLPMGQPLSFTYEDFQGETIVEVVVANPIPADREPVEYGMEPSRGLFVVVDVSVRALPESEASYFVAADGTAAESTYVGEGFGPELPTTELSAGQQIAGKVGFDIAPGQEVGGRIQINDSGENYGEPFAYWAL